MLLRDLREQLVEAAVRLLEGRLVYLSAGNLSARDPDTGLIAIKPSGGDYVKLVPNDILVINERGDVIEGADPPSSETPMHTLLYRRREDVNAVIHTHSPMATAWSLAGRAIPPVTVGQFLTGPIPIAPYAQPGTRALGEVALETMGEGSAVVLQNHGPLVVGATLRTALTRAFVVEEAATVALHATLLSDDWRLMTEDDLAEILRGDANG